MQTADSNDIAIFVAQNVQGKPFQMGYGDFDISGIHFHAVMISHEEGKALLDIVSKEPPHARPFIRLSLPNGDCLQREKLILAGLQDDLRNESSEEKSYEVELERRASSGDLVVLHQGFNRANFHLSCSCKCSTVQSK